MPRFRSRVSVATTVSCQLLLLATACVSYDAQPLDLISIAHDANAIVVPAMLTFPEAVGFAMQHNPQLQALAAQARAAGADIAATEIQGQWSSDVSRMALMIDPVALLRLGQRGAAIDVTKAREGEALAALAVARWRLIGRIAEVFAAHAALDPLRAPEPAVDVDAFTLAGLASPNAAAQASGAMASAAAEAQALAADREALLAELRTLLGLPATATLAIAPVDMTFPPLPPLDEPTLLTRPDLALAHARLRVVDAEFRRACADQYPSIQIGPDLPLGVSGIEGMAWFKIPLDASGPAQAARHRRIGARANLVDAFVNASNDAAVAELVANAAASRHAATATTADASARAATVAQLALAVEVDAFDRFAEKATMAVRDAGEARTAAALAARTRVRLATARGWPAVTEQP